MDLFDVYAADFPEILKDFAATPSFERLKDVGMHCGCEYTSFRSFSYIKDYSRWEHSIGVALIVWNFTKDEKQAVAGLLHDICTPVFSHVVDFLNKDYVAQESTEAETRQFILNAPDLKGLLEKYGFDVDEVADYHIYPIADNDMPGLSADRLEYHTGNFLCRGMLKKDEIAKLYSHLYVAKNEAAIDELAFDDLDAAKQFVKLLLSNSRLFVADEDRFSMEYLAGILRKAVDKGILKKEDFYLKEKNVIEKLSGDKELKGEWDKYRSFKEIYSQKEKPEDCRAFKVPAKKRYVNPLVKTDDGLKRVVDITPELKKELDEFLSVDFDRWIYAK